MSVLIAERKGVNPEETRTGRTSFVEILQKSSVVVLCCPLDSSTRGMIQQAELKLMEKKAILVNVSRGGVVDELALVEALEKKWIRGAATDVFAIEPATLETSPLLAKDIPNLTLSPHVAWYANSSIENLKEVIKSNIEGFVGGRPANVVS
jgi:phosphoglycerate dehydrogenase-like enzyme